jgi:putative peptidoglycan lipid II flippase
MVPALFGVSVSQLNLLVDTLFASFLIVGSVSWLYYSDRLLELPLGVFGVAIATVILPHLSRHHATQSHENFSLTIDWALRCVLLVSLPATVALAVLAGPMLSTLFQHGHLFNAYSVEMAQKSLAMFALGVTPFMLVKILTSGFYAKQDMRTPVRIGILSMIANMVFNVILIWPLAHAGIALSTTLAAFVNTSFLYYFLYKKKIYSPSPGWKFFSVRIIIANSILGFVLWFGAGDLQTWTNNSWIWRTVHLFTLLGVGAFIYFAALWLTGLRIRDFIFRERQIIQNEQV